MPSDTLGGMKVARGFYIASAALAVALAIWASVNAILFDGQNGPTFIAAGVAWLAGGLPLLLCGLLVRGVRQRRTSLTAPNHWADWKRQ